MVRNYFWKLKIIFCISPFSFNEILFLLFFLLQCFFGIIYFFFCVQSDKKEKSDMVYGSDRWWLINPFCKCIWLFVAFCINPSFFVFLFPPIFIMIILYLKDYLWGWLNSFSDIYLSFVKWRTIDNIFCSIVTPTYIHEIAYVYQKPPPCFLEHKKDIISAKCK